MQNFNNLTLEQKIYSYEKEYTAIGIGNCKPFYHLKKRLENTDTPFVKKDINKRIYPKYSRETAKSIIAIAFSYNKKYVGKLDNRLRGKISIGAIGTDYHVLVKNELLKIRDELGLHGDAFVDTGYLVDREVAKRCKLGVIGKNFNLINEKLGSIVYLGYLLVDEVLKPTRQTKAFKKFKNNICKNCDICIKACPGGAIKKRFDYKNCISYLTQCKTLSTEREKALIGKQIYGCDICQKVCPYNKDKFYEKIEDIDLFYPDIEKLLFISNAEFENSYKKSSSGWRGKKILQRNAIIALANDIYKDESIALLKKVIEHDKREDIKQYAIWAIDKLNKKKR